MHLIPLSLKLAFVWYLPSVIASAVSCLRYHLILLSSNISSQSLALIPYLPNLVNLCFSLAIVSRFLCNFHSPWPSFPVQAKMTWCFRLFDSQNTISYGVTKMLQQMSIFFVCSELLLCVSEEVVNLAWTVYLLYGFLYRDNILKRCNWLPFFWQITAEGE